MPIPVLPFAPFKTHQHENTSHDFLCDGSHVVKQDRFLHYLLPAKNLLGNAAVRFPRIQLDEAGFALQVGSCISCWYWRALRHCAA